MSRQKTSKDENTEGKIALVLLGLLLVTGTEPFKVLLRRNIRRLSLSIDMLYVSSLLFFLWGLLIGIVGMIRSSDTVETDSIFGTWIDPIVLFSISAFHIVLAIIILIRGRAEYRYGQTIQFESDEDIPYNLYRGESILWSTDHNAANLTEIWSKKEPRFCFFLSLFLTIIHPLLGLPLLLTSIAFWFNEVAQVKDVFNVYTQKIIRAQLTIAYKQSHQLGDDSIPTVR